MDYAQDSIATLHDLQNPTPDAPLTESAVVIPIAGDSHEAVRPRHIFETLSAVDPGTVVVSLRAPADVVAGFREWVAQFDLSVTVLWCNADTVEQTLAEHGLDGTGGKGRDVWLGVGVAAGAASYVAVHDADATTYDESHVPRLLAPLELGYEFVKGYYARVENGQLYGRLARLFVAPLLSALQTSHDHPLVRYLSAFRYPLAGEFAFTAGTARRLRAQRAWGLEIGLLGEAYRTVGERHTAQADLGIHRHDHRPVDGSGGLATMAEEVGDALFRVLEDAGIDPDYQGLPDRYRQEADRLVEQYAADAAFNGLGYDSADEREQVRAYADGIQSPGADTRLPAWETTSLTPDAVFEASQSARVQEQSMD